MNLELAGRAFVTTAASPRIGEATAELLFEVGAQVVGVSRNGDRAREAWCTYPAGVREPSGLAAVDGGALRQL